MEVEEKKPCEMECSEMFDFIIGLQEDIASESERLFSRKKELEEEKKQIEQWIEAQEKFQQGCSKDLSESEVAKRERLKTLNCRIEKIGIKCDRQQVLHQCLEKLKNMFFTLHEKLQEINDTEIGLIDVSTKILETQEMDRNRISRDLHDSSVQGLTALVHKMEYCIKMIDKDPVRVKLELQTMIELNKEIINGMREIIYNLRPMSLNNLGLASTIDSYCLNMGRCTNVDIIFYVKGKERGLPSIMSVTLYRIVQEAISNILQHASAKRAVVVLTYLDTSIELSVEDNGKGFDMNQTLQQSDEYSLHGFGLSTMRERTKLLKGTFSIDSVVGKGTRIYINVPAKYIGGNENDETDKDSNSR